MTDKEIIEEAKARWAITEEMLGDERTLMLEDIKFSIGNSENNYQWNAADVKSRNTEKRPALTMNKLPQFINQVVNDARANVPSCKIRPVDSGADKDSAEIYNGLCRNIENTSQADIAYDTALEYAARCGLGYFRLRTDYLDDTSFNQDLIIESIADPLSVRLDPFYTKPDGSDAKWGFVESSIPKKEFEKDHKEVSADSWEGAGDWHSDNSVRVVEYFRIVEIDKTLQLLSDGSTNYEGDALPDGVAVINSRKGKKCQIEWYKLTAVNVIEKSVMKMSNIPIYPVVGNQVYIEGRPMRSGMVRNSKGAQIGYNVTCSLEIEHLGLSPKAPWVGYRGQFEDPKWATANTKTHAFLEVDPVDINGNPAPLPQRVNNYTVPSGLLQAKQGYNQDIRETMGMYNASIGANSSETSGRAILAKQKEGDTGTFHYVDNLGRAKGRLWRDMIEMIPSYYDVQRVARVLGEDGSTSEVHVDPQMPQALAKVKDKNEKIKRIFNPNIGRYDVVVTVGASYATQRMEAAESQLELAKVIPQIGQVAPDLMARSFDFKGADELADRLKATLPAGLVQEDDQEPIPPQVQQAIQQVQQTVQMVEQHKAELAQREQQIAQQEAQVQAEMEKLAVTKQVMDAHAKLAKTELENQVMKAQQSMADDKVNAEAEQQGAYVSQLEQMVEDLSKAIEENDEQEVVEQDNAQTQMLVESMAKLTEVVEKLSKPVKKIGTATKDPMTGQVVLSVVEVQEEQTE